MKIIAVDDEKIALEGILREISHAEPEAEINGFRKGEDALSFVNTGNTPDVAFLDIEMPGTGGVILAKRLLESCPGINIIFTTGYSEYALEAIDLRCSGYILKPITSSKIRHELDNLRNPVEKDNRERLYARTFGKFEVFIGGRPVKFRYQKTKELLAYLIDRKGVLSSNVEIISALWEDDSPESSHISYLKNIRTDLMNTLEEKGCVPCITRERGEMGILTDSIDCDYYEYLNNKDVSGSEKLFRGEYMSQYSWSEYTLGKLMGETLGWN